MVAQKEKQKNEGQKTSKPTCQCFVGLLHSEFTVKCIKQKEMHGIKVAAIETVDDREDSRIQN